MLIVTYVPLLVFCLCCSVYCLCVNVYCTTATGCQPNYSKQVQGDKKSLGIFEQSPHDDLKMAITEYQYIRNVDRAVLNTVFENTVRRVNKCLETGVGHFEHYL
jgi:hypothetical protein